MNVEHELQVNPDRIRQGEPRILCGNSDKFQMLTGWKPKVDKPEKLIQYFLEDV
jgi:GDP-D-mannose dehydratase